MEERAESRGLTRGGLLKVGAAAALVVGAGGAGRALAGAAGVSGAAPALAGAAGAGFPASGVGKPGRGPAYLERETYVPLVGTDFRVHRPGARALKVKLIEARPLPSVGEAFSLHFRAHPQAGVEGGTRRLSHPALGDFDLFIAPVGRGVKGLELEAVIYRIAT